MALERCKLTFLIRRSFTKPFLDQVLECSDADAFAGPARREHAAEVGLDRLPACAILVPIGKSFPAFLYDSGRPFPVRNKAVWPNRG